MLPTIGLCVAVALLLVSILFGVYIGYALTISLLLFALIARRGGHSWRTIAHSAWHGAKKNLSVALVIMLIGILTATWMASGTVATLVDSLVRIIHPSAFLVYAFAISCVISLILGSSFATCSTIGAILMILAHSGGVNLGMTAGAVFSGAIFGDHASPMSPGVNLVTDLSESNLYRNVVNLLKTSVVPLALCAALFAVLSADNPLRGADASIGTGMAQSFTLSPWLLLPAALVIVLILCRIPVRYVMMASIVCAVLFAVFMQGYSLVDMLRYMWSGFTLPEDDPLVNIVRGGGLFGQFKNVYIILVACALSELFGLTGAMRGIGRLFARPGSRTALYAKTLGVSFIPAAIGCNGTITAVMTSDLAAPEYNRRGIGKEGLALDLGMTAIIVPCIVPWSLAVIMSVGGLGFSDILGTSYMPYIFFMYAAPLYGLCRYAVIDLWNRRNRKSTQS